MAKDLFFSISAYGRAIQHVSKYGLWGYVLLPGLISVLLGAGIIALSWGLSDNLGAIIDNLWVWEVGKSVVGKIAQFFGGLLILILGLVVFKQLAIVISSPLMSVLSEKVENQLVGTSKSDGYSISRAISDIIRSGRLAIRNLIRELFFTVLLLLLGLIPIFSPFTAVLILVLQAYYAGFGNLDFALERHFGYKDTIVFVKKNKLLAIGNGIVYLLMLFSFIGFLFALPLGTVAATIVTVERLAKSTKS